MKLDKKYQIEKCVGTDMTGRKTLTNVFLSLTGRDDKEGPCLIATDGRMLAIVPAVLEPQDVAGYVTPDQCKLARKGNGVALLPGAALDALTGINYPRPTVETHGQFPQVLCKASVYLPPEDRPVAFSIRLDADRLLKLALALGAGGDGKASRMVTLEFSSPNDPIVVKTDSLAYGLLMPARFE